MAEFPLFAVLMAGGSGTRFWPASRRALPKQFLSLAGGRSMIAQTSARLAGLVPPERVLVVAGEQHAELVRAALPELPPENLLREPAGRNTLPCVALAAFEVARRAPRSLQIVLPADHVIEPAEAFRASLAEAAKVAEGEGALVTFGIRPTYPATGYGYVELAEEGPGALRVRRFVEKPERARAEEFLASGRFLWNSGIFVWRTDAILSELRRHAPATASALEHARPEELAELYPTLEATSIDVGIMEKARELRVLPIDYRWSDVGSWAALSEVHPPDGEGNSSAGGTLLVAEDSTGCVVFGEPGTTTALVGVHDLVVVHAGGATLVCPRARAEEVKGIVERLARLAPDRV